MPHPHPPSAVADSCIVSWKETFLKDPSCPIYGPQVCAATGEGDREGGLSARQDSFPSRKLFENAPSDLSCAPRDPRLRERQETPGLFHIFLLFIFISAEVWEPVNNRQLGWQEITRISERNVIILATGLGQNRPFWISCLFISQLWWLPRSQTRVVRFFAERTLIKIS